MADILGLISGFRELVTLIETCSVAETTAANTRISDLIEALESLAVGAETIVVEAPNVTVRPNITVNCGCGGGGSTPPQTPGEEGGTPPPGTEEPSEIELRKCKVATILIQELIAYTDNMAALGLFDWSLDYLTLGGILNSIANGFTSGLLKLTFQVGGWLTNLQNLIFSGGFGASIPATLSSNQEAMVCALYNSENVVDAKSEVVTASGLTGADASYLELILTTETLNMLFFSLPGSEEIISSYAGTADCSGCNADECALLHYGSLTSGVLGTFPFTVTSELDAGYYFLAAEINCLADTYGLSQSGFTQTGYRNIVWDGDLIGGVGYGNVIYSDYPFPAGLTAWRSIYLTSSTSFSVTFTAP
jgi:hypothetical protein